MGTANRIFGTIHEASRVLFGTKPAGRAVTVFPDDVFLCSYPRSGNTWTRFLISNLISPGPVTFVNVESLIPSIYLCPDRVLRRSARPRILKSHECFDARYKQVIYIVRDPRDVAVSFYHYNIKVRRLPDEYPIDAYITRFVQAEIDSDVDRYGSWHDHVLSWIKMQDTRDKFLLLRYEDMLKDPIHELARIASFLQINASPESLSRAVNLSSADRMRSLEKKQARQWKAERKSRLDKPFVRSADSGNWQSVLSETSTRAIERQWGETMKALGYRLSTDARSDSDPIDHLVTWQR